MAIEILNDDTQAGVNDSDFDRAMRKALDTESESDEMEPEVAAIRKQIATELDAAAAANVVDLVIVGGGPAGLSAAVNASSEGLTVMVAEADGKTGGQAKWSSRIENYLGFPSGLPGAQLMSRAEHQAEKFHTRIRTGAAAQSITRATDGRRWVVALSDGATVEARAVLIASGLQWRRLEADGAAEQTGKTLYYGATPESAEHYRNRTVVVIGGANSAGQAAVNFADHGATVEMVVRGDGLDTTMSEYLIDRIKAHASIHEHYRSEVSKVEPGQVTLKTGETLAAAAVFVFIGAVPKIEWMRGICQCDAHGFLVAGPDYQTNAAGIFAAGDIRSGSVKRVAAAVGEGAEAIAHVEQYLATQKENS